MFGKTLRTPYPVSMLLFRLIATIGLVITLYACSSMPTRPCSNETQVAIYDLLYFGSAKPNGLIAPAEWVKFLNDTVTPRFPQGLSVWDASGQWRSANGVILREPSHILNLVHSDNELAEKAVQEIIDVYKFSFQQKSVLRIKTQACQSF